MAYTDDAYHGNTEGATRFTADGRGFGWFSPASYRPFGGWSLNASLDQSIYTDNGLVHPLSLVFNYVIKD